MPTQLSSSEQKILRDGLKAKPNKRAKQKEQLRIKKLYGLNLPLV